MQCNDVSAFSRMPASYYKGAGQQAAAIFTITEVSI